LKILTVGIWSVQLFFELREHRGRKSAATLPDINQFLNPNLLRTRIREFIVRSTRVRKVAGRIMQTKQRYNAPLNHNRTGRQNHGPK
jgi:hypothetical protein